MHHTFVIRKIFHEKYYAVMNNSLNKIQALIPTVNRCPKNELSQD